MCMDKQFGGGGPGECSHHTLDGGQRIRFGGCHESCLCCPDGGKIFCDLCGAELVYEPNPNVTCTLDPTFTSGTFSAWDDSAATYPA